MSLLGPWVEAPFTVAVGWTVVHSLWQGTIISAALAATLIATRSPRIRYAAACLAILAILGGSGITLLRLMTEGIHITRAGGTSASLTPAPPAGMNAPGTLDTVSSAVVPYLAPFWSAGVCIVYLWQLTGWFSLRRLRRRGVCPAPVRWEKELVRLRARLGVSRPIALLESCLANVPMVIGHLRPVILLPVGLLAGLPPRQVEAVLLHELAHIRRWDYFVNVLQRAVEGLLFYHPAVWWISRVIRAERENCCDDVVVEVSGKPHEYAVALAALERSRSPGPEPAVAAAGGSLVKRIHRLLYPKEPAGGWIPLFAAVLFIATAGMALAIWQVDASKPDSAPVQREAGRNETSLYLKWLNEDAVYIIADEERTAFESLVSDEEREKFIEQFWSRRDPKPDTVENELKKEHYRRIAYANHRFAGSNKTGWKTDRGRVYIQWGPPDQIEAHPAAVGDAPPFEIWRYRHLGGIAVDLSVTFVDRMRTGDYPIAPGPAR
jgi:GWxTD domain-containing protein